MPTDIHSIASSPTATFPGFRRLLATGAVLLTLTAGVIAFCLLGGSSIVAGPETGIQMNLPSTVGDFAGIPQEVSEAERIVLPDDTEFQKMLYSDAQGDSVNAQIVLAGAERRSIHRPELCLPGQGWTIKSTETLRIDLPSGSKLPVTMLRISRPIEVDGKTAELDSIYLYWFVGKDTVTASHLVRVLKTNLDVLLTNTNHRWAYVIASSTILDRFKPNGKNEAETLEMLEDFIQKIAPDIMKSEAPKA